jgi:hypothetical protein
MATLVISKALKKYNGRGEQTDLLLSLPIEFLPETWRWGGIIIMGDAPINEAGGVRIFWTLI